MIERVQRFLRRVFPTRRPCPLCGTMLKMYRWEDVQHDLGIDRNA